MIGALDQRITFQSATLISDGQGGNTKTWANVPSIPMVWAFIKGLGGKEANADDRVSDTSRFLFTIRNRTDIDETITILWGGETFNIRHVRRLGDRNMYLEIEAERGVAT